jgi:hypothetical protein
LAPEVDIIFGFAKEAGVSRLDQDQVPRLASEQKHQVNYPGHSQTFPLHASHTAIAIRPVSANDIR